MATEYSTKGKVALIIGCVQGIGLRLVRELIKGKVKGLALLDVNTEKGDALAVELGNENSDIQIIFHKCDVTSDTDIRTAFDKVWDIFGTVDIAINCAGILCDNKHKWKLSVNINVIGMIECSLQEWHRMRRDKGGNGGTIINFASIAAIYYSHIHPIYSATKFAIRAFTEGIGHSEHFAKYGVRFLSICPQPTDTALFDDVTNSTIDEEWGNDAVDFLAQFVLAKPENIASSVLQVYQSANSGTSWIVGDGPPEYVPATKFDRSNEENTV